MELGDLAGADVVLLGIGVETLSVLPRLRDAGVERLRVVEAAPLRPDQSDALVAAGIVAAEVLVEVPTTAEVVLRSPGFPAHRGDVAALRATARLATTPTGLWLAVRGGARTIAVTGTKGKSSTVTLIVDGLSRLGVDAFEAGNIGTAAWEHDPHRDGVAVVELSSYHGADLIATGEVCVLTLLAEDHLDWHGSVAAYRRDKLHVLTRDRGDGGPPEVRIALQGEELPEPLAEEVTRVPATGDHRDHNVALAVAAITAECRLLGRDPVDAAALTVQLRSTYPELPGRFATVRSDDGITWIDDALGSNPSATAAALRGLADVPVVLICGGHDRHVSLDPVLGVLAGRPRGSTGVVWLGRPDDHRYAELIAPDAVATHVSVGSMSEAVRAAADRIEVLDDPAGVAGHSRDRETTALPTVIFSPLAPTERTEGAWADRSRAFGAAVAEL